MKWFWPPSSRCRPACVRSLLSTIMNNVGSTTLWHPVFINFEQVIIFRRVVEMIRLEELGSENHPFTKFL